MIPFSTLFNIVVNRYVNVYFYLSFPIILKLIHKVKFQLKKLHNTKRLYNLKLFYNRVLVDDENYRKPGYNNV